MKFRIKLYYNFYAIGIEISGCHPLRIFVELYSYRQCEEKLIQQIFLFRCIPFRFRSSNKSGNADTEKIVELLMINSTSGPGLLFPKVINL